MQTPRNDPDGVRFGTPSGEMSKYAPQDRPQRERRISHNANPAATDAL